MQVGRIAPTALQALAEAEIKERYRECNVGRDALVA
jgi:hypothetical protein